MSDIVAFAGSIREGSFNQLVLRNLVQRLEDAGSTVTMIDLRGFPMPMYDAELEAREGLPTTVRELKSILASHRGLLIASPEYNSSYSPLLKNTIDWTTRSEGDEPASMVYQNKIASLVAASPGGLGGLRGLMVLRMLLQNIGVTVLPHQLAVPNAYEAFDEDGGLINAASNDMAAGIAVSLSETVARLSA